MKTNSDHPHLWLINARDCLTNVDLPSIEQLHTTSIKRFEQFASPHRKRIFMLSRWLIKTAFTSYLAKEISYQQIIEQPFSKPKINSIPETIHYSLSHSKDMIVLLIDSAPVGIDIELKKKRTNADQMAKEFMATNEVTLYSTTKKLSEFYSIWCRKEAYYKSLPKRKQYKFNFKELDTLSSFVEKNNKKHFFNFSFANYQICSFHQTPRTEINFYLLNSTLKFIKTQLL